MGETEREREKVGKGKGEKRKGCEAVLSWDPLGGSGLGAWHPGVPGDGGFVGDRLGSNLERGHGDSDLGAGIGA